MDAIILAGGFGTRLRGVVDRVPKPMAPISGRPFLEILLKKVTLMPLEKIILSVGYMSDEIKSYFGEKFNNVSLIYSVESEPLGTGGAVKLAMERSSADKVIVFNGDTFLDLDLNRLLNFVNKGNIPCIVSRRVSNAARYGSLTIKNDKISSMDYANLEVPGLINAGCYIFPKNIFYDFKKKEIFSLETDFLPWALTRKDFYSFSSDGYFIDIGIPEDYHRAQTELLNYIY
jgi:D-glycero-alpha-D-manno-heptose 1-phosphate guanylyltransferase